MWRVACGGSGPTARFALAQQVTPDRCVRLHGQTENTRKELKEMSLRSTLILNMYARKYARSIMVYMLSYMGRTVE